MESCMPVVRGDFVLREVEGETLVLDRAGERIHQLNATASHIWSRCDGQTSQRVVAEELATQYGIAVEDAAGDIAEMLSKLRELGLVEER